MNAYQPMLDAAGMPIQGPTPMRYGLMQQEMDQSRMYTRPYTPSLIQSLAVMGAGLAGYRSAQAMPFVHPGERAYDAAYAARVTTPLFNQMQARFNYGMGMALGMGAGQLGENLGMRGNRSVQAYYEPLLKAGGSPAGQMAAQLAQANPFVQSIMGGDLRQSWQTMFANRNFLAFQPGQLVNPESRTQQVVGARYAGMLMEDLTRRVYTDAQGRQSLTPNLNITGGMDVGKLGDVANMIATLDPKSRGMSTEVHRILDASTRSGNAVSANDLKKVKDDIEKYNNRVVDTTKALAAIGEAIGSSDVVETADVLNKALQGNAFKMDPKYLEQFGRELSAAQKVYGISAERQLAMQTQIGGTYAQLSGAVNPVTGKVDSQSVQLMSRMFTRYAMTMAAETGKDPEEVARLVEHQVGVATGSTNGRLSQLIEAKYRTGQFSEDLYNQFQQAMLEGDGRKQQALVQEIGQQTGRDLFRDANDPTQLAHAIRQIDMLPSQQKAKAIQALYNGITQGPQQEMNQRVIEGSLRDAGVLMQGIRQRAGVPGMTQMSLAERDAAAYAGYSGYLRNELAGASGARRDELEKKIAMLESGYKQGGMNQVNKMLNMDAFRQDRAGMQLSAKQQIAERVEQSGAEMFSQAGVSGKWLSEAAKGTTDKDTLKKISDAQTLLMKDPAAGARALSGVYKSMSPEMRAALGDPAKMLSAAAQLGQKATMDKIDAEVEKRRVAAAKAGKDPGDIRWENVAGDMFKDAGQATIASAAMLRRSQLNRETGSYLQRLNSPQAQKALRERLEANAKAGKEESMADAIKAVVGVKDDRISMYALGQVAEQAGRMGMVPEQFWNAMDKGQIAKYRTALEMQIGAEGKGLSSNLKLNPLQRIMKYATQDKNASDKMSIWDVLGVSVGAMEQKELVAVQKELAGAKLDKDGRLPAHLRWMERLGDGPIDIQAIQAAKQSDAVDEAIQETRSTGRTKQIDRLAKQMGTEQAGRSWLMRGADSFMKVLSLGIHETREEKFAAGAREVLLDAAESGKKFDAKDMGVLKKQMEDAGVRETLDRKKSGGGRGDHMKITLDSAKLVIDMGGKQYMGSLGGEGDGYTR